MGQRGHRCEAALSPARAPEPLAAPVDQWVAAVERSPTFLSPRVSLESSEGALRRPAHTKKAAICGFLNDDGGTVAPEVGLEPTTNRLTADRSTN
jgi:hypothetical protein